MKGYKKESVFQAMYRYFYSLALLLCLPLLLLVFRKKMVLDKAYPGGKRSFKERLGIVNKEYKAAGVLIHCVSMGELNASVNLVRLLLQAHPNLPITISTTSTTGAMHAFGLYKDTVQHTFLPIDLPFFMQRFFDTLQPKLVLVTEVEVWPNMVHQCLKRKVPRCLINARLSDDSLSNYRKLRFLLRPALRKFDYICAQSQSSFDNYLKLGVYKSQLCLTRNMKFDIQEDKQDEQKAQDLMKRYALSQQPILVAASTHEKEETFILNVYKQLKLTTPTLRLFIVPRHPQRFEQVYLQIKASGSSVVRFSEQTNIHEQQSDVVLIDTMGYLKACYKACSVAFIGGSIADKGGHNPLECALYAKPMVMGLSTYNNPEITDLLNKQGALAFVDSETECLEALRELLDDKNLAKQRGLLGKQLLEANRGAVEKTYRQVEAFLKSESEPS